MFQLRHFGITPRTAFALVLITAAHLAPAATNIVTSAADDASPGTLRLTISNSLSGDTIIFAPNLSGATILLTNYPSIGDVTNSALVLGKSLTIDASALPSGIQINGNHQDSVFKVNSGTSVLTGLTITNGYAYPGYQGYSPGDGGGILNNATLTLNRCILMGNIAIPNPGNVPFLGILPGHGGGGLANFGILTVNQCTFAGNNSGIYNDSILTVNNSTVSGSSGSALINGRYCPKYCGPSGARATLNQCTLSGNGYGISTVSTNPFFINQSTLSGNAGNTLDGYFTLSNSIIAGAIWPYSTFANNANNFIGTNANLSPLGYYGGLTQTMPPLPGSPAIDNGSDTFTNAFATDQRGSPRLSGLHVDIGAVESVAVPPTAPLAVTQPATGIGLTVATLNATVTQNGAVATCYFQFGTTTNYGTNIAITALPTGTAAISNSLTGLAQGTLYHFRIVATNDVGTTFGNDLSFQTGVLRIVSNTNDNGPGSLRDAIGSFAVGDSVLIATNLSGQTILLTNGQITISNSLTVDASTLPGGLTIDGHTNGRIFQVTSSNTVALDSLTITNGKIIGDGGGIYNAGTLTLSRCTVAGNTASANGGGITSVGALTLNSCTVAGNTSSSNAGGGIYNGSTLTLSKSTVAGNSASSGGGIYNNYLATINQCTLAGNFSAASGGGLYNQGGMTVNQSTVSDNHGTGAGGGIYTSPSGLTLFNSILAGNTGAGSDPNLYVTSVFYPPFYPTYLGTNVTSGDPILAPLGNYGGPTLTMPPLPGSPAIDNGSDAGTNNFASDQRDLPRLAGLHVDIGAVESSFAPAAPLVVTQPATGIDHTVATLNGSVTPNGAVTTCYFQYGITTNYGAATTNVILTTGTVSISGGLSGLSPGTIYHFRAVGVNSVGTTSGADSSFQTVDQNHIVTNTNDNGPGSLRDAILHFAAGDTIAFATNLAGKTILLTSGQITINTNLTLDAATLPGGLTIKGTAGATIFQVASGATVVLDSLTITQGGNSGIYNAGTLTLNRCTIAGNTSSYYGGGIYNTGILTLNKCTVAGNATSFNGGGIGGGGTLIINQSTLSGNSGLWGGGVYIMGGTLTLNQSTVAGNSANWGGGTSFQAASVVVNQSTYSGNSAVYGGGGIYNGYAMPLSVSNSIVAGNTASSGPNIDWGSYPPDPALAANITNGSPLLCPLGNYGGPTQTMPPLPNSPAIDGCTNGTLFTTDQRDFPRPVDGNGDTIAVADIGAVEGFAFPNGPGMLTGMKKLGNGTFQFGFPNYSGLSYTVLASTNLATPFDAWSNLGPALEIPVGSGQYQFTDPQATNNPQRYYRVRSP